APLYKRRRAATRRQRVLTGVAIGYTSHHSAVPFHSQVSSDTQPFTAARMSIDENNKLYSDLVIFDDTIPCQFSPFRVLEYSHYASIIQTTIVTTQDWYGQYSNEQLATLIPKFTVDKDLQKRIIPFSKTLTVSGRLGYVTFLQNGALALDFFERNRLPFL